MNQSSANILGLGACKPKYYALYRVIVTCVNKQKSYGAKL